MKYILRAVMLIIGLGQMYLGFLWFAWMLESIEQKDIFIAPFIGIVMAVMFYQSYDILKDIKKEK